MFAQRSVGLSCLVVALQLVACSNSAITKHPGDAGAKQGSGGDGAQGGSPQTDTEIAAWPMPNDASLGLPNSASYDDASTPGVVHDLVTGLDWPELPDTAEYTRADAISYCEALSLGGIDDWRLPAFIELASLFDVVPRQDATPAYIASVFQTSGRYWSTSVPLSNSELGRLVDFNADGCSESEPCSIGVLGDPSKADGGVLCVHSTGPPPAGERFDVAVDHIDDTRTGLRWFLLPTASQNGTEADAVSRCAALGPGVRVPSITELISILTPVLDPTVFPGWPGSKFAWSSSTIPARSGSFWAGGITGASEAAAATDSNRIQCVR